MSPTACRCLPTEGRASLRRGRCQAPAAARRGALALRAPGALVRSTPQPRPPCVPVVPRLRQGPWACAASAIADRRHPNPGAGADAGAAANFARSCGRRGRHEDQPPRPSAPGRGLEPAGATLRHYRLPYHVLVPGHAAGAQAGLRPGRRRQLPQLGRQRHRQ